MIDSDSFSSANGGPDLRALYGMGRSSSWLSDLEEQEIVDLLVAMASARGRNSLSELFFPGMDYCTWPLGADAGDAPVVHSIGVAGKAGRLLFKLEERTGYFYSIEYRKASLPA